MQPIDVRGETDPASPAQRFTARLSKPASAVALRGRLLNAESAGNEQTVNGLMYDDAAIEASQAIVGARRRYVLGAGRSKAFAALMAWDLSVGLSQVIHVDDSTNPALDLLTDVRSTDVLVVFSFRRYLRMPVAVAKEFTRAGGLVVAITDDRDAPIADVANVTVIVPTISESNSDSPTGVSSTVHLIATLANASAKGARRRIEERERLSGLLTRFEGGPA